MRLTSTAFQTTVGDDDNSEVKKAIHLKATKIPMVMSTDASKSLEKCAVVCHAYSFTTVWCTLLDSGNCSIIYQGFFFLLDCT